MNVRNKTKTRIKQYGRVNAADHPSTYPWCSAWFSGEGIEVSDDNTQNQLQLFRLENDSQLASFSLFLSSAVFAYVS